MGQKRITDLVDMAYKGALIRESAARTEAATPSFNIPGTDVKVTGAKWVEWWKAANKDERSAAVKNYEYAVSQGFKGSFEQFQNNSWTTNQKDYQAAKASGYTGSFNEWLLQMRKAGAAKISIGEKVETKKALDEVSRESEIQAQDFAQNVKEDLMKDKRSWRSTDEADKLSKDSNISFEEARDLIQRRKVINEMGKRIRSVYKDKNVEAKADGWYVDGKLVVRNPYAR